MRFVTAVLFAASLSPAWGQACGNDAIRGTYSVVCTGYISPAANAPQVPFSAIATIQGDFTGNITGGGKASIGGQIVDQKVTGTAVMNGDCTGSISYTQKINGQSAPNLNIVFHVLDNGKELRGMSVDPGATLTCSLKLMSR
jgi:hypothetical protein